MTVSISSGDYERTDLYACASHVRIRPSNLVRTSRILHDNRIRNRAGYRRPANLKVSSIVAPSQRYSHNLSRTRNTANSAYLPRCIAPIRSARSGVKPPRDRRLTIPADTAELMHSRECWVPRISSEEVVAKVRIEGIAHSEAVKVAEWLQFSTAAVGVCGLECPLYAYVSVFVEAELRGAATEVEGFVVTGRRAPCVWVAPGRTALLACFESKRGCCASRCQKRGDECKSEFHDSGPRRRGMSKYIRVQGTSNLNTGADTTVDVTAGPMHQNYTQTTR
jgi:hypothetical protein